MFENPPNLPNNPPVPPSLPEKNESLGSRLPEELLDEVMKSGPGKGKVIIFVVLGLIILAGITFGGYVLYQRFFGQEENLNVGQVENDNLPVSLPDNQVLAACYLKNHPEGLVYFPAGKISQEYLSLTSTQDCSSFTDNQINSVLAYLTADRDQDGLNNIVEQKYSTDDNKKDTDADGYDDLTEINNGYDPNGPGKL